VAPLTVDGIDKTGPSNSPKRSIWFPCFELELSAPCSFHVPTHFGDSARESTTSSMKKGGSGVNRSDLNNDNIVKPTFNTLTEEDWKALEAYRAEVDELFFSRYAVT
jgi:hypothetical protein